MLGSEHPAPAPAPAPAPEGCCGAAGAIGGRRLDQAVGTDGGAMYQSKLLGPFPFDQIFQFVSKLSCRYSD